MIALRLRQAALLVVPLWRAGAWSVVPACAAVAFAVIVAFRLGSVTVDPAGLAFGGAMLLGGTVAFAADDASDAVVAPSPAPRAFRGGVRLGGAVLLAAACWALVLAYAASVAPGSALARPTLLAATLVAVGLLAGHTWGGVAGGPAVVGFLLAASHVPDRWSLLDTGAPAAARLSAVLAAACALLALRLRDPAASVNRSR